MKTKKYHKTKKGKGWNKDKNMSNNAVTALENGYTTWNDYEDKKYFIGEELESLHFFVAHAYVRHHFGNKKEEKYMFPKNILDLIDSNETIWVYYHEDYIQEADFLANIKKDVMARKKLIESLKNELTDLNDNDKKIDYIFNCIFSMTELVEMCFVCKADAISWSAALIKKEIGCHQEINNILKKMMI